MKESLCKYRSIHMSEVKEPKISTPSILRLAARANITGVTNSSHDVIRGEIHEFLTNVISVANTFREHSQRRTLGKDHVLAALDQLGYRMYM